MRTREERAKLVKELPSEELLEAYVKASMNFNPLCDEFIFNYNLMKDEIIRRMKAGDLLDYEGERK